MFALALGWLLTSSAFASEPARALPAALQREAYVWHPQAAPFGLLVVVVSVAEQRVYVYRSGVVIGQSAIGSGRAGYETPNGVFTILHKDREHHSNRYGNAPMPFPVSTTAPTRDRPC